MALPPDGDYACVVDGATGQLTIRDGGAVLPKSPAADQDPVLVRLLASS